MTKFTIPRFKMMLKISQPNQEGLKDNFDKEMPCNKHSLTEQK